MLKAAGWGADGAVVLLGLSDRNVEYLREDRPVVFDLAVLGLPARPVCVAYRRPDGRVGVPRHFAGVLLSFTDAELAEMSGGASLRSGRGDTLFVTFRGKDEAELERMVAGLIGPVTRVRREGFAPSDLPPGRN